MMKESWEGKIIEREIDGEQELTARGQHNLQVTGPGPTTGATYLILYRTRHGSVTTHECALCLAGADGRHPLRSENPTWYRLKPFASLTFSFSFLYMVFLSGSFYRSLSILAATTGTWCPVSRPAPNGA